MLKSVIEYPAIIVKLIYKLHENIMKSLNLDLDLCHRNILLLYEYTI